MYSVIKNNQIIYITNNRKAAEIKAAQVLGKLFYKNRLIIEWEEAEF